MVSFASPEWIAALDLAARADDSLGAAVGEAVALTQVVVDATGEPIAAWTLRLGPDGASVSAGRADDAQVVLRGDAATVGAIARGELSAQEAFLAGRLRLGGDVEALLTHAPALAALGDVFATVRADTEW